jgi:hypothetical protein
LASAETRANSQNTKKGDNAAVVDWWDAANSSTLNGTLTRVDCVGKQLKLQVKEASGALRVMLIADPNDVDVKGGEMKFSCGVQKAQSVVIHYKPASDSTAGVFGEVVGIEYK